MAEPTKIILNMTSGKSIEVAPTPISKFIDQIQNAIFHGEVFKFLDNGQLTFINTACIESVNVSGAEVVTKTFKKPSSKALKKP